MSSTVNHHLIHEFNRKNSFTSPLDPLKLSKEDCLIYCQSNFILIFFN